MASKSLIVRVLTYDPDEMARRGRLGAARLHANRDGRVHMAPAHAAFMAGFARAVDPDGVLTPEDRNRLAAEARRDYFSQIGKLGAAARLSKRQVPDPETGS